MRISLTVVTAVVCVLALASAASAATVAFSGDVLTYNAASGEENDLGLARGSAEYECSPRPVPCLVVDESVVAITSFPADRCSGDEYDPTRVVCALPASTVVNLGDRDDLFVDWDGPSVINGGPGNEVGLSGRGGDDMVNGDAGNDALFGDDGDDRLNGGDGDDFLDGFGALFPEEVTTAGADVYAGGPGTDLVDYGGRTEGLTVTLDGADGDGAPGEGDNVGADVEHVRGGVAADTLTGNAARNDLDGSGGDDTLRAGAGEDTLRGGEGDDRLLGEDGQDTLDGSDGNDELDGGAGLDRFYGDGVQVCIPSSCDSGMDRILARDGVAGEQVSCGPGEDTAVLDGGDSAADSGQELCEHVDAPAGAGSPSGGGGAGGGAGEPARPGATLDAVGPVISRLRLATRLLRRGRATTISWTCSEAAQIVLRFERARGRRHVPVRGAIRRPCRPGANRMRFAARVGGRRLRPGRYRVVAVAHDAAGNRSTRATRASFRVAG